MTNLFVHTVYVNYGSMELICINSEIKVFPVGTRRLPDVYILDVYYV